MKREFKVGERYKVNAPFSIEYGNIIEITEVEKIGSNLCVSYKTLSGKPAIGQSFEIGSPFSDNLIKLDTKQEEPEKPKFKVGDRVKLLDGSNIDEFCGHWVDSMEECIGDIATIKCVTQFRDGSCGYDLDNGWTWDERALEPYSDMITIYQEGRKVIAKFGEKTGVARCNPADKFDFLTGAKLALNRLYGAESMIVKQDHYYVGDKVKIVKHWTNKTNENSEGKMDKWLGKIMTIRKIDRDGYKMVEYLGENYGGGWFWNPYCIAGKVVDGSEPETTREIKVGDIVRVVKNGESYCTYSGWFEHYSIEYDNAVKYDYGNAPLEGDYKYKVLAKHPHKSNGEMLYMIRMIGDGKIYLISEAGIKLWD